MASKSYVQPVLSPEKSQTIRGIVVSPETGLPQGGVDVRLEHDKLPGLVVATTTTNAQGKFEFNEQQVPAIKAAQAKAGSPLFHAVFSLNGKAVGTSRTQQALSLTRASAPSFRLESLSNLSSETSTGIGQTQTTAKQRQRVSMRVRVLTGDAIPVPRARIVVYDRPDNPPSSWEPSSGGVISPGHPDWSTDIQNIWTYVVGKGATANDGTATITGTVATPVPEGARRYVLVRVVVSDTESVVRKVAVNPSEVCSFAVHLSEFPESLTVFGRLLALEATAPSFVLNGPIPDLLTRLAEPGLPTVTEEQVTAYRLLRNQIASEESPLDPCLFAMAYATRPAAAVAPQPGYISDQSLSAASLASFVERADSEGLIHSASPTVIADATRAFISFVNAWDVAYHNMAHAAPMVRYAYFALAETGADGLDAFRSVLTSYVCAGSEINEYFWSEVETLVDWGVDDRPTLASFRDVWEHYVLFESRIDVLQKWYGVPLGTALTTPITSAELATRDELAGKTDSWWSTALFTPPSEGAHVFDREYVARVRRSYDERVPTLAVVQRLANDATFGDFDNEDEDAASWLTTLHTDSVAFGRGAVRVRTL